MVAMEEHVNSIAGLLQQLDDEILDRMIFLEENNMDNSQEMSDLEDASAMLEVIGRLTGGRLE